MRINYIALAACAFFVPAGVAVAQSGWVPGSELIGHSAQVQTDGVLNTVHFDAGGSARVVTPNGTTIPGSWSAANGSLCLSTGGPQECWPYAAPFQAGQAVTLTSNCQGTSTWTALSTNMPPPPPVSGGERG